MSSEQTAASPPSASPATDLEICVGVPEEFRQQAAQIYYQAFEHDYRLLFGSSERAISVLSRDLNLPSALGAVRAGCLVGIAGFCHQGRLAQLRQETLIEEFNWLGGEVRYLIFRRFTRPQRPGRLLMDGIATDSAVRGTGVGTALLRALFQFAREHGYDSIRLDVVNTNTGARRLYERLGFAPVYTTRVPPVLRNILGYSAVTTMIWRAEESGSTWRSSLDDFRSPSPVEDPSANDKEV